MQKNISGIINLPKKKQQQQLHSQLGEFMNWMQRPKDAKENQKDKRKSLPTSMLPMVF